VRDGDTKESLNWWRPKDKDFADRDRARLAVRAQQTICALSSESYRRDKDLFNIRLYSDDPVLSLYSFAGNYYADVETLALPIAEQSVNNKAKAAIDTAGAQIASTEQRARFRVVDGNYRQRRRSREMQNFADGLADDVGLQDLKQMAWFDAAILESGVGAIQFYEKDGRCAAKRLIATSLSIDPLDGLVSGQPRVLYYRSPVPRDEAMLLWGGKSKEIDEAIRTAKEISAGGAPADHIEVFECWALRTGEKSGDGWHIVALDNADGNLVVEEFTRPRHDVVLFSLERKFTGPWGRSLMSQARKLQLRINANSYRIDRAQKLFHAGHLYVNTAWKVKKSALSNEIGSVWEGNSDIPPQQVLYQAVTSEMYEQVEKDGQRIFDNLGINIGASTGSTALGANAPAEAIREETTKSDKRNAIRQQRYERFHVDCIHAALGIVRSLVEGGKGSYKVAVKGKRGLSKVDWKDAALDEKNYVIDIKPASPVPTTPAGLVAYGKDMVASGVWTAQKFAGYLQDLDADGRTNRQMSQERNLEKVFESLLYDKASSAQPDEFTNYDVALEIGTEYLAQGEEDEVPEKNLERVRRYLKKCKTLKARAMSAAQPPPTATAGTAGSPDLAAGQPLPGAPGTGGSA
jgi:hypothetical protein